ncbi:hypothetical protein MRX96_019771 [Rhipicephalus microplus]
MQFLGHKIDATGLHPLRDNLDAVTAAPRPAPEDSTLRQIREWIEQGWPSRLTGQQQHLQPYFTHRHELVMSRSLVYWGYGVVAPEAARHYLLNELHDTHTGGQCLPRPRLPDNDFCRSQRHPFSHPESPSGTANFNKGRNGCQGQ